MQTITKFQKRPINTTGSGEGKLPPQARMLEEVLLGAIMTEESAIHDVIELIKSEEVFYTDAHQRIYKAMRALYYNHVQIDLLTLTEQLKKQGDLENAGGTLYLVQLSNSIGSSAHITEHARLIIEKHILRKLIAIGNDVSRDAYTDTTDVFDLLDRAGNEVENINLMLRGQRNETFAGRVLRAAQTLKEAAGSGTYITGVPTFSHKLDGQLLGFQPADLVVVASRPGMGKTSMVWHMAKMQARHNIPVGFFSLEMNDRQLINKMFASETAIDLKTVARGGLKREEWQRFDRATAEMMNWPVYLDDTGAIPIHQLIAVAKNWVRKHGVKIIYIDYIQLITTGEGIKKFGNREQEVSYISAKLKATAKELNIPVVALSQLSRGPESRSDKRPLLSDLRESGAIEQDADIVIFPFRPAYYGLETDHQGHLIPEGYTELDIAKYRNGEPVVVRWLFEPRFSRFKDFD